MYAKKLMPISVLVADILIFVIRFLSDIYPEAYPSVNQGKKTRAQMIDQWISLIIFCKMLKMLYFSFNELLVQFYFAKCCVLIKYFFFLTLCSNFYASVCNFCHFCHRLYIINDFKFTIILEDCWYPAKNLKTQNFFNY